MKYETRQRKILLEYLYRHVDEPMTAQQIVSGIPESFVSVSAVYRNLSDLEEEGKVRRLTKEGSRKIYYIYQNAEECSRHLHFSCSRCGKTYHLPLPVSDFLAARVEEEASFLLDHGNSVLSGVCKNCR